MTPIKYLNTRFLKRPALLWLIILNSIIAQGQTSRKEPFLKRLREMTNRDSANTLAKRLTDSAHKNHDQLFEARVLLAQAYQAYGGGFEHDALLFGQKAANLTSLADPETYERSGAMIAYMLSREGKTVEALKVAFKVLKECDTRNWKKQSIDARACIADVYRSINNDKQALPYAQQAAKDALSIKDTGAYIFALSNLSNIYSDKNMASQANIDKATRCMEEVLSSKYAHFLNQFTVSRYQGNLGRLYVMQNKDDKAISILQQSLKIANEGGFKTLAKHDLNELLTLYVNKKDYKKAIEYGEMGIAVQPEQQSNITIQKNIYSHLTEAYEALGNYEQAFKYAQLHTRLNDSLTAAEKARDASELDKKYQTDKRLLIADNQTRLIEIQRNYLVAIAVVIIVVFVSIYRWFLLKKRREANLLAEENKQLEKLDKLKTKFFANISHELRTPLTLIMGPTDQLLNLPDTTAEQRGLLLNIERDSKKLLNIVNELLDLGKLEAGKLALKPKPVELAAFIKLLYLGFASAAEYKRIKYSLQNEVNTGLFALLDQEKFEKIINNLVGNAIKFTPHGGTIILTAAIKLEMIEFTVANTGPGIHPDDLPHIFDRYYQGLREDTPLEGGTGIGLAIVREFAELMGGRVNIENKWGEGAIFKVDIPLVTVQRLVTDSLKLHDAITNIAADGDNKLVMLVEDHPEMAAYIARILQPSYLLITASNGREALNKLHAMPSLPHLIISDVMMPGMDGFALLETLKQSITFCNIPVIMLTALADTKHKLKALHTGVDDYLTKPFLSTELLARAANLISNAASRLRITEQDEEEYREAANRQPTAPIENEPVATPSPADMAWLAGLEALVRKNTGKTELNVAELSYELATSERQLFRRVKAITGLTPNKYVRTIRLQIAREAIESGKYRTVAEVSYIAGFDTPTYFSKLFKEHYGRDITDLL